MSYSLVSIFICSLVLGSFMQCSTTKETKICGLNFVAPPEPYAINPMDAVRQVSADWIAVIPYAFGSHAHPHIRHSTIEWQWWGEKQEGVEETIKLAHEKSVQVMLKPQVYIHNSWPGGITYSTEEEWKQWEHDYTSYILNYARIAEKLKVAMFCVGTEFDKIAVEREQFWRTLIAKIKTIYKGKLAYSANWDAYQNIPFWDALDYIGISAYFPLVDNKNPAKEEILLAWNQWSTQLIDFAMQHNKQFLFTEYGYLSVDGAAGKTWELEKTVEQLPINQLAQATAYDAMFEHFAHHPLWAGGFLWKWFPNDQGHEGYPERDYTPQGKLAESVLVKWHKKMKGE